MNILLVHPHDLFDKSEPWTVRIKNIAREFTKTGHQVKICYFPVDCSCEGVTPEPSSMDYIRLDRTPSLPTFIKNTLKLIRFGEWADVIHFQKCQYYASLPAVISAYINRKPLHYDWDDWEEKIWYESCGKGLHSRVIGFSFKMLERLLPLLSDSVSCASSRLKELSISFGVKGENIFDSPVGADTEKFVPHIDTDWVKQKYAIPTNEKIVLYIGQLHGAQHVDLLINGANIVLHKYPGVKFMIVGEGFLEWKLKQLAHTLGIDDKIIFTGAVDHKLIPSYICAADICVAPFRDTEVARCKSPLKIVEYMSCGKAIVASNVGEVRKMLGGVGILTEAGNYYSLAEGMLKAIKDERLCRDLGRACRERIERKYNWFYAASNILKAYDKIVKLR